ncbi:MAG: alkaline phosphatase family protein [Eubacteriales bacterium]|nr:alkaline phosphatase family protein [Eubacteriales bacterium]
MSNPQIFYPDYDHSILNLASSILQAYGVACAHPSLPVLDQALAEPQKNRIFLILDGMGAEFIRRQLAPEGFFNRHVVDEISSVYPCTTTAATTTMLTGLSPAEHGWLGWSPWFREYGRIIDVFLDRDSLSGQEIKPSAGELLPFVDMGSQIYAVTKGAVGLHRIQPNYATDGVSSFDEVIAKIQQYAALPGPQLILAYWNQPDSHMHNEGPYSDLVQHEVKGYEMALEKLMSELTDSLLVLTADHGQVTITHEAYLDDYPDILDCLVVPPSLETRAVSFFVKNHRRAEFVERFQQSFGTSYQLMDRDEVLARKLFGPGVPNPKIDDFLGDFLACAIGDTIIRYHGRFERPHHVFHGHHAGLCAEEMIVPLIITKK